jgi:hypothetical protein
MLADHYSVPLSSAWICHPSSPEWSSKLNGIILRAASTIHSPFFNFKREDYPSSLFHNAGLAAAPGIATRTVILYIWANYFDSNQISS